MTNEELQSIQTQLQEKKAQIEKGLSGFAKKDPNLKGDWDSTFPRIPEGGMEEAADEVEEYSTRLHLEHSLELQLKDVVDALQKIEKGTYGSCEKCGTPIQKERLEASLEARLCGQCNA